MVDFIHNNKDLYGVDAICRILPKDSYAAPLAKTVFSLPFVVICNSAVRSRGDL